MKTKTKKKQVHKPPKISYKKQMYKAPKKKPKCVNPTSNGVYRPEYYKKFHKQIRAYQNWYRKEVWLKRPKIN